MDIGRAFNYPLRDPNWLMKLLIGLVVSIIPIINFIMVGYQLRATRMVLEGIEDRLPEWDEWGDDFMRGLYSIVGSIIYFLPTTIVYCFVAVLAMIVGEDSALSTLLYCCTAPFIILYSLVAGAMLLMANLRYASTWDFNDSFFDFSGRWREVTQHISELVIFALYAILTGAVIGFGAMLTIIICGLGLLVAVAGQLIMANLQAQLGIQLGMGGFKPKNEMRGGFNP